MCTSRVYIQRRGDLSRYRVRIAKESTTGTGTGKACLSNVHITNQQKNAATRS